MSGLNVPQQQLLSLHLANVAPHGEVFNEHLKVVVVFDGVGKHVELLRVQRLFAQQEPLHVVQEGNLDRQRKK